MAHIDHRGVGVGMGRLLHSTSWPKRERDGGFLQEARVSVWQLTVRGILLWRIERASFA